MTLLIGLILGTSRMAYNSLVPAIFWHSAVDVGRRNGRAAVPDRKKGWRPGEGESDTSGLNSYYYAMTRPQPLLGSRDTARPREFKLPTYDDQVLQIQQYIKILLTWNEKVNLTAIRDPLEILYRHFCESMYAAEAIP